MNQTTAILPQLARRQFATLRSTATPDQVRRGRAWYREARAIAAEVGAGDVRKGAGILAALSPQNGWDANVAYAREYGATGALTNDGPDGYFPVQLEKAGKIRDGARPLDVLRGPKERDFYLSIVGATRRPCIDRHMVAAAGLTESVTPKRYGILADACADLARERREPLRTLQAIVWLVQRERDTTPTMPF